MEKILVTGSAGFIGSALSIKLLEKGYNVIGIDNHNDYYDPRLKEERLSRHIKHENYEHFRFDIKDIDKLEEVFEKFDLDYVVNLAAQAGVRYSLENPSEYINTNILGFYNVLELSKKSKIKHLIYASSSSVYGSNRKMPFSTNDKTDHPLSLYGATKKTNELIAHSYSHLYKLPTTGLRFFTVYGPWGRPDMALYKFTEKMIKGESIEVYNRGLHKRDFTYIDDIIEGILLVLKSPPKSKKLPGSKNYDIEKSEVPWRIYNIGNSSPVFLETYIQAIESALGVKSKKELLPLQPGDVLDTYADVTDLIEEFGYKPKTEINDGVRNFVKWYKKFNNIDES